MRSLQRIIFKKFNSNIFVLISTGLPLAVTSSGTGLLSLGDAKQIALKLGTITTRLLPRENTDTNLVVTEGQLHNSRLEVGIINLPLGNFDHIERPMTQSKFGLSQASSSGLTHRYWRECAEALSEIKITHSIKQVLSLMNLVSRYWRVNFRGELLCM